MRTYSDRIAPYSDGIAPYSDGIAPYSDGIAPFTLLRSMIKIMAFLHISIMKSFTYYLK